jgi:uncharacterized cupredoxin-like copper-binding protein
MSKPILRPFALILATGCALSIFASVALARTDTTSVTVTAGKPSEFRYTLSKKIVPKGIVTFAVTNRGRLSHDFKVAGKKTARLASGKRATLKVTFSRTGRYAFVCTVPGHAAAGMKGVLTVK